VLPPGSSPAEKKQNAPVWNQPFTVRLHNFAPEIPAQIRSRRNRPTQTQKKTKGAWHASG
jgi:hypothetical protein